MMGVLDLIIIGCVDLEHLNMARLYLFETVKWLDALKLLMLLDI